MSMKKMEDRNDPSYLAIKLTREVKKNKVLFKLANLWMKDYDQLKDKYEPMYVTITD